MSPGRLLHLEVMVTTTHGRRVVSCSALELESSLVVHRGLGDWGWTITHRASGRAVAWGFITEGSAFAAVRGLLQGVTDWEGTMDSLEDSSVALEEVEAVCRRWGGKVGRGSG